VKSRSFPSPFLLSGILKRRFPALHYGLRTKVAASCDIIVACCVLHNIGILWGDEGFEEVGRQLEDEDPIGFNDGANVAGEMVRDWLCRNFC
jgi:hypothetical protein